MILNILLLLSGFILLIGGANYLIKSSVAIASKFKISHMVIGLTLVAFGTSAPELFVSLIAALKNHPEISTGNVVGSNICNILLIIGLVAIITNIPVTSKSILLDWGIMMTISIILFLFILDNKLARPEGIILFVILISYISYLFSPQRKERFDEEIPEPVKVPLFLSILISIISIVSLALGSSLLVDNTAEIARKIGISERIIAITLIAVGTSIPELVTSIIAAIKKNMDISIGNIIGSNIFNISGILGLTSIIKPIPISHMTSTFDIYCMLGSALFLLLICLPLGRGKITFIEGFISLLLYLIYIILLITLK